jgi:hypothetical protein
MRLASKRKRWNYKVYYAGEFVKSFTSRDQARSFMQSMTDVDLPFIVMPWQANQVPYLIGELK